MEYIVLILILAGMMAMMMRNSSKMEMMAKPMRVDVPVARRRDIC